MLIIIINIIIMYFSNLAYFLFSIKYSLSNYKQLSAFFTKLCRS